MNKHLSAASVIILLMLSSISNAQKIQYWRPYDQSGLHVFETPKEEKGSFDGMKIRIGGGFTQQLQKLTHTTKSALPLYQMNAGFNTAQTNLHLDVQLADGIRFNTTSYLSSRSNREATIKGFYVQFDKLPFKRQVWQDIMKVVTIKLGHMEINYGDQHFRRSDGGNTLYNPFIENYILDAFATEIGGEIYAQKNGIFAMIGLSSGTMTGMVERLKPDLNQDSSKRPAVYFKAGIDKKVNTDLRLRASASYYINNRSASNTLYNGDRTGSNYYGVIESKEANLSTNYTSGRFNPQFSRNNSAMMVNGFAKYKGLEFFGTFETAKGSSSSWISSNGASAKDSSDRKLYQYAAEAIYRIGKNEQLFIGARYNLVDARPAGYSRNVQIDRTSIAAGWFPIKNLLLKGEYVFQKYIDFKSSDIRHGATFDGWVVEAVIGF
jgi:hypothetical protein